MKRGMARRARLPANGRLGLCALRSQQFCRGDLQCRRQFVNDEDGRIPCAALDPADVGAVQARLERQMLLRPAAEQSQSAQVNAHLAPDIHTGSQGDLHTIVLQTMSNIYL